MNVLTFPNRLAMLKHFAPADSIGAEIGVFRGDFAALILAHVKPRKLYLLDMWQTWADPDYAQKVAASNNDLASSAARAGGPDTDPAEWLAIFQHLQTRFPPPTTELHRGISWQLVAQLPCNSLDWVYIDADHRYCACTRDLEASWLAVQPGGYIMGHDFCHRFPGVMQAVLEFAQIHAVQWAGFTTEEYPSYALRRPPEPPT